MARLTWLARLENVREGVEAQVYELVRKAELERRVVEVESRPLGILAGHGEDMIFNDQEYDSMKGGNEMNEIRRREGQMAENLLDQRVDSENGNDTHRGAQCATYITNQTTFEVIKY